MVGLQDPGTTVRGIFIFLLSSTQPVHRALLYNREGGSRLKEYFHRRRYRFHSGRIRFHKLPRKQEVELETRHNTQLPILESKLIATLLVATSGVGFKHVSGSMRRR